MGYDFQKISKLIEDSGKSKKTLFSKIGMSDKTFTSWINGSAIPKETDIRKIAERLGVSLSDLRTKDEVFVARVVPSNEISNKSASFTSIESTKTGSNHADFRDFLETELQNYHRYSACIIFDTCSIMNYPDLLEFINEEELAVVPKVVLNELEHNKMKFGYNDAGKKAQRAIAAIYNYDRHFPLAMADDNVNLIPEAYRTDDKLLESNDNKILSVVIRYKQFTHLPVVFITDDYSLSMKATGENICVCSAEEFIRGDIPPFPSIQQEKVQRLVYDPLQQYKQAEENNEYNKAILYSIILKQITYVRKHINEQTTTPIRELAELYISLRTKKDIPLKQKIKFAELKNYAADYISEHDIYELTLSFAAAYQDALSSLSGSIKQIAGDLE